MDLIHNNIYHGIYNNLSLIGTQLFYQVCILEIRRYEVTYQ